MKIGELSKKTNVSVETIRYYEREGVIPETDRTESGYRIYGPETIDLILFIKHAQNWDFSLSKIKKLLDIKNNKQSKGVRVKLVIEEELKDIDDKIESLTAIKNYLLHLTGSCSGEMFVNECPILKNIQKGNGVEDKKS